MRDSSIADDSLAPEVAQHDEAARARHLAGRRSTMVSVYVNIALSIAQAVIGIIAGSQALVAD
ncbi:MAG: cation-efflux pump, partial [Pseudomonadota bacterium]